MQQRLRQAALEAGVTLVAPDTVYLAADTKLGRDVTVEPYVVFGPGVTVEEGATIRSFSHLEGAHVGKNAIVGPLCAAAAGAKLEEDVHIGNFVEVKEALIEAGAKANHLALYRRRPRSAQAPTSAPAPSPAITTARPSTAPTSARPLHRLEFVAGGAGQDRRGRLCRIGLGDHHRRARGRAGLGTGPANRQGRLGKAPAGAEVSR